jgi:transposase
VLADLVPGGFSREITAGQAAGLLRRVEPADAIARARCELAAEFLADLRRLDAQIRDTRTRLAAEVRASGSTLTGIFGVGPVIAAAILGAVGHVSRFADRDRFAAYNGTAPIEVSSGERKIHRLSLRGNRRLNHAIHMAAITQIRYKHSPGRAYYDRKIAEGKTGKEALRCLKRRLSDTIYARLQADARTAATAAASGGPGGQSGNDSDSSAAGSHPGRRLFGQATPGPAPTLRAQAAAPRAAKPARSPRQQAARPARRVTTT